MAAWSERPIKNALDNLSIPAHSALTARWLASEDERPIHQPYAPDAPIPGIHHYSGCDDGYPRVNADGRCESCGKPACPHCGKELCKGSCPEKMYALTAALQAGSVVEAWNLISGKES